MNCCLGLAYSDIDDIQVYLPKEKLIPVFYNTEPKLKRDSIVCVYGIKTFTRNKALFEKSNVFVLIFDAIVRFRGFSIRIVDAHGLSRDSLIEALNTKSEPIVFVKPENVIHRILLEFNAHSFLNPYIQYRYSINGDARKKFDANVKDYFNNPTNKKFDNLFLEGNVKKMMQEIARGQSVSTVASRYDVEQYDLQYCVRLAQKIP